MEFKTKREIKDSSGNQSLGKFKVYFNRDVFAQIKELAENLDTFASEIIRQLVFDFIANYSADKHYQFKTKRELADGTARTNVSEIKLNLNKDDFNQLRRIAEENNTYASEIIRQLMADFVANYEKEHEDERS